MKLTDFRLLVLPIILALFGMLPSAASGQLPPIEVTLTMSSYVPYGQAIGAKVTVRNEQGQSLLVNRGFMSGVSYLKLMIIDPAGRLIIPHSEEVTKPEPDPQPLPFIVHEGRQIQAAECEVLRGNKVLISGTENLGDYYSFTLPGYYTAQVQIDAAVYKGLPCDLNDFQWQGVLKSQTRRFYYEGNTRIKLSDDNWPKTWKRLITGPPGTVSVTVYPPEGRGIEVFDKDSIRLNGTKPLEVRTRASSVIAYFSRQQAFLSLGNVASGRKYPVAVTGTFVNGTLFGGARLVTVTSP
jgi:hypothetical protein